MPLTMFIQLPENIFPASGEYNIKVVIKVMVALDRAKQKYTHDISVKFLKNSSGKWELARLEFENLAQIVIWR